MEGPMMKLSHIVILTLVAFALVFTGCDSAGAGGGGGGGSDDGTLDSGTVTATVEDDDTVTVSLSGATDLEDDLFAVYLYSHDEHSIHTADRVLAVNYTNVGADGTASFTLKVDNGSFEPSSTDWVGTSGTTYDMYIYTDSQDDGAEGTDDYEPATSERAFRAESYPMTVTINDGATTAQQMVAYAGGTVTVELSNAASYNGNWFYYGIFLGGAEPATNDALAWAEKTIAEGSAESENNDLRARFEGSMPFYAVDGTSYDVYAMIDMDGSGHSDGITDGDLLHQFTFTQNGSDTNTFSTDAVADYEVYNE
jgi:hypothetical protein